MSRNVIDLNERRGMSVEEQKKETGRWIASSGVFVLLLAVALVNHQIVQGDAEDQTSQRHLASLSSVAASDSEWQKWLNLKKDREIATIGVRPSLIDQLTAEVLEGKYSVRLADGRLKRLEFTDQTSDRPKYIRNRAKFIETYSDLLHEDYVSLKLTEDLVTADSVVEVYELFDQGSKKVARVQFKMDPYGRLLVLTVE